MGMLVMFSCSLQEGILCRADTLTTKGTISFHLRRVIPTALHSYKQGGWGGRAFGVAWWRHGIRLGCHTESIAGEDGTHLDKGGLHLGNRRNSRRDLDNHGLRAGCETLVRR